MLGRQGACGFRCGARAGQQSFGKESDLHCYGTRRPVRIQLRSDARAQLDYQTAREVRGFGLDVLTGDS